MLDRLRFYSEIKHNLVVNNFMHQRPLSRVFVPFATFDEEDKK